jgi:hypothetical protein
MSKPEQQSSENIDRLLEASGWQVQNVVGRNTDIQIRIDMHGIIVMPCALRGIA